MHAWYAYVPARGGDDWGGRGAPQGGVVQGSAGCVGGQRVYSQVGKGFVKEFGGESVPWQMSNHAAMEPHNLNE